MASLGGDNFIQQVLPAARTTTSLGRVLGRSAPKIAAPAGLWACIGGLARRSGHIFACDEDATSKNVKVKPALGEKSQKHILLKYMSKRNDNFAKLMDKFRQAGKLREKKLIISLLVQEYDKNLTQLNRSDFACLVGENRKLIDTKKYQKLLKSFIADPYFVVRCEGYENLEYYKSFDWSNTLINAAKTEKHPYAQGYLFNAFRGHMNPRTLRFLTGQLDRQKRVRVLSSIYCALIEFARDYSLVNKLLGLFDRARDYSEIYSIFSSMQDLSLPLPARIEFTNKLNEILAKMDKKLGLAKDLRTIIKTMKESRSWASSNRKLSYVQIANI